VREERHSYRKAIVVASWLFTTMSLWATGVFPAAAENHAAPPSSSGTQSVVAAVPRHWPPQYSTDKFGEPTGFAIDVMNAVAERAGITVIYKAVDGFPEADTILMSGDADIIPSSGIIPARQKVSSFTAPVETMLVSIFVRDDTLDISKQADLVGHKVAVVNRNVGMILMKNRTDIDIQVFPDVRSALFQLVAGQVDALIYPKSVLLALTREIGIEDRIKTVGKPLKEIKRGIRVRKENVDLLSVLDKAVKDYVGTQAYQQVYAKWYGKPKPYWSVARILWLVATLLVGVIAWHYLSLFRLNQQLKKTIKERQQKEMALHESEMLFETLMKAAPVGVYRTDVKGECLYTNEEWCRVAGIGPDQASGHGWSSALHHEDRQRVFDEWDAAVQSTQAFKSEYRFLTPAGDITWVVGRSAALYDQNDEIVGYVGTVTDITERKQAEESARSSKARLHAMLKIVPEAVIAIGQRNNIRLFNTGAERIFGYMSEEVVGQPLDILMPARVRGAHAKYVEAFHRSSDSYRLMDGRQEITGLRKDGSEFPASASISKLELSGETIFTVLLHDITERKRAELAIVSSKDEAEIANYTKTQFLANMSHELRTPLNSIIGFSQILVDQEHGPLKFLNSSEYATHINHSANHLLDLIQDILDVSKIEAHELDLDRESIDFKEIVADSIMMVQERAAKGSVMLSFAIDDDIPTITADEVRLKQILLNLLSNAIKFTPEGGRVTVSVGMNDDGGVSLKVNDTGIGISKKDIPKVLRPFGQVRDIFTRNHDGTGLGLSLAKSLVELHDGNLEISSRVGKGTTVTVDLPTGAV